MINFLKIAGSIIFTAYFLAVMPNASAENQEVRIGVLSFRELEQTRQQWQATADTLNARIVGVHFTIVPMYYRDLDLAVNRHDFDFVLTNPEHYITIRADHALSAIATLMPMAEGHPVNVFGGVVLTRADRKDINTLADLRGKVVASPSEQSLGGYLMQRWVLFKHGIDISQIGHMQFTGMPHDKAVLDVLIGRADAGFVRTGVLENMAREGKIRLEQVKVLELQPAVRFPQLMSTDLYPEWPFAVMPDVPEQIVKPVMLALLQIQPEDSAARSGRYYGFSPPGDYASVEAMMVRLKVNPERAHEFDLHDVLRKYAVKLIGGGLLLLLAMLTAGMLLARTNRRLQRSRLESNRLERELQQANTSLEDKVAVRTRELQESEARFRRMFEGHASPMLLIEPDSGNIVNANHAAAEFYGYSVEQMQAMNIRQINAQAEQEIAEERLQAQLNNRNYLIFPHRLASGEICSVEVHSSPVNVAGRELLFSIIHDITERRQLEAQMHDMAFYDPLTKLPNRRLLVNRLHKLMSGATRNHRHAALMFLDLDHFKILNDLRGHDIGDQMLVEVAKRILSCLRADDSAARFGGDEFVVLIENLDEELNEAAMQSDIVAEKIRHALSLPYLLKQGNEDITHFGSSSIGVTVFSSQMESMEQLLKWTDMAMYHAKDAGRNVIRFFDPDMQTTIETRAALEADLRTALAQQQFRLAYQVQVNDACKPQGAEVLLRWQHPSRGLVSPLQFISLAEDTGLIVPIGEWVLDTVCAQIRAWEDDDLLGKLIVAVNVSARQFRQADFVERIQTIVQKHGIQPKLLKLELTESLVLDHIEESIGKMNALKDFGVNFSMDDFGTGYSSLSYLKRLPLRQIKIDQSFVRDITTDATDLVMVKTIVDLGLNFEMNVIAEGVETKEQLQLLEQCGCTSFQGYFFSEPIPLEAFEVWVRNASFVKTNDHENID